MLLICVSLCTLVLVMSSIIIGFLDNTKRRTAHYAHDSLNQISRQLTDSFDDIRRVAFSIVFHPHMQEYLTTSDAGKKFIELYPVLSSTLDSICTANSAIYDILLFYKNGQVALSCQKPHSQALLEMMTIPKSEDMLANAVALPAVQLGETVYYPMAQGISGITTRAGFMNAIGTFVIICDGGHVQSLVHDINIAEGARLFVVDHSGTIIASNAKSDVGEAFELARYSQLSDGAQAVMDDGSKCIVQSAEAGEWTVFSIIPLKSLFADSRRLIFAGVIACCAAIFVILFSGHSISLRITRGVTQVVDFLGEASEGHTDKRVNVDTPDELRAIALSINRMLDRQDAIQSAVMRAQSELYEARLLNQQSQFTALQRQINPHFLFNTLSCIASICAVNGVPEAVNIASSMARIFRYCIKGADIVTVREEAACIRDYIGIIELRFRGRISGSLQIPDELMNTRVPKMILQPIVENAVFHGLEPKRGGGCIRISAREEGARIVFEIADDGIGMPEDIARALQEKLIDANCGEDTEEKRSIGLINIAARLRFLYGDQARVSLTSAPGMGTAFILKMPLARGEQ